MFTPKRVAIAVVISSIACITANAFAAVSAVEGVVKDAAGQPLKNAEIRIEGKEGPRLAKVTRTDGKGHYNYTGLGTGTYKVTLATGGSVKASIANVMLEEGSIETLNFELKKAAVARPTAIGKHYVWIPASTGSHLAGTWVEVVDNPNAKRPIGMRERLQWQGNAQAKYIQDKSGSAANAP